MDGFLLTYWEARCGNYTPTNLASYGCMKIQGDGYLYDELGLLQSAPKCAIVERRSCEFELSSPLRLGLFRPLSPTGIRPVGLPRFWHKEVASFNESMSNSAFGVG